MKIHQKIDAITLRRRGNSLSEISDRLGLSKSTISLWTRGVEMSNFGVERINNKIILSRQKAHEVLHRKKILRLINAEKEADDLIDSINRNRYIDLVALSVMYWCEGAKENTRVSFTNSDPKLLRSFIVLLENNFSLDIEKLKVCVHLHDYHYAEEILKFWSEELKIPQSQFTKPYTKLSNHKYKKVGYKGCVTIRYHNAHVARVLHAFAKKLINLYI